MDMRGYLEIVYIDLVVVAEKYYDKYDHKNHDLTVFMANRDPHHFDIKNKYLASLSDYHKSRILKHLPTSNGCELFPTVR